MNIIETIKLINHEMEFHRGEFERFIKDKSVSLEERWKLFCEAPDQMSNNEHWLHDFESELVNQQIQRMHGVSEIYGRGKRISLPELVDEMIETVELPIPITREEWEQANLMLAPVKEEILEKNLKSFCYDW